MLYCRYIDEGITGTSIAKRKNFVRMMEDAKDGHFDLIVTREVSRFARNTVDTLQQTRLLKRMGIEVYFTEDGIWTMNDEDGELRLTIMATLAQNESKKTSMRVKAGQRVSFQNGVIYGTGNVLGYDKVGPEYVINEAQAKTVRKIFDLCLAGNGYHKIMKQLEKDGHRTAMGKTMWHYATIGHILKNRLYCGELEYRKEYVPDYLEQKRVKNNGELEQQMMQYGDVKPATEADVSGKLENLQRLMEQFTIPEDGEFSEEQMDKYVSGVRVYEDRFEWLLNLSPEACGELDDAGSPVYFTKLTVTPDDERAWFRMHPQWSKSNKYAELEAWIYI